MNFKAMAAIAATLIVCVPLALGYGLAIDEEETTALESTKSWSISDMMLNNQTPYYGQYLGASNNDLLLNGSKLVQVGYNKMSSTATSYPTKSTGSGTLPLASMDEQSFTMSPKGSGSISADVTSRSLDTSSTNYPLNVNNTKGTHTAYTGLELNYKATPSGSPDYIHISINGTTPILFDYIDNNGNSYGGTSVADNVTSATFTMCRNVSGYWSYKWDLGGALNYGNIREITISFEGNSVYTTTYCYFSSIQNTLTDWSSTFIGVVKISQNGSYKYIIKYAATPIIRSGSTLTIGTDTYTNVSYPSIASGLSTSYFTYYPPTTASSSYFGDTDGVVSYTVGKNAEATFSLTRSNGTVKYSFDSGTNIYIVYSAGGWRCFNDATDLVINGVVSWSVTISSTDGWSASVQGQLSDLVPVSRPFSATWSDVLVYAGGYWEAVTSSSSVKWDGSTITIGSYISHAADSVQVASFLGKTLNATYEASAVGTISGQVPEADSYRLTVALSSWTLRTKDADGTISTITRTASAVLDVARSSATTWTIFIQGSAPSVVASGVTGWDVVASSSGTMRTASAMYSEISSDADTWSFSAAGSVRLTRTDGTAYAVNLGNTAVTVTGSSVIAGGTTYTGVQKIEFAQVSGSSLSYTYERTSSTGYGDPSEGWTIPYNSVWFNGQTNESVTFIVSMPLDSTCGLSTGTDTPETVHLQRNASGRITIWDSAGKGTVLGSYGIAMIEVGTDEITVTGLAEWPAMGSSPTRFNTISYQNDGESFEYVKLRGTAVTWRVDSAQALAGTFPSTKDYTVDLAAKFPTVTQSVIQINSVGVYGSSLTVAGRTYDLENGSITVQDLDSNRSKTLAVRGMTVLTVDSVSSITQKYDIYLSGVRVGTSNAPGGGLAFGGEWSLTATLSQMDEVTHTTTKWQPGEFALDDTGVVAAGLLTALGAFVVLGMTGRASGPKAALLAVVCGGAAMIMLILI